MKEEIKQTLVNILRWIVFLPASILGSWLAYVFFNWMNHTIPQYNADNLWNHLIELLAQIIMGGAFVAIGTSIVPKGNKIVAIILFAIICVVVGVAFIGNLQGGFSLKSLLGEICILIGAGFALYELLKKFQ